MRLPKIQEDESPLKNDYFQSIMSKPYKKQRGEKLEIDWQAAESDLISRMPDEQNILEALIDFQQTCKKYEVPHFYSYFTVRKLISQYQTPPGNSGQLISTCKQITKQLQQKQSSWDTIFKLIKLRQTLMSKISKAIDSQNFQTVYEFLDDVRFLNCDIIKKVKEWKQKLAVQGAQSPIFVIDGKNYLVKMINDNSDVINGLSNKTIKFLSPPNPFFLSRDGNKNSMSHTQQEDIDNCMEILAHEKAQELKSIINPPKYVTSTRGEASELEKLKNQLQSDRIRKIKSIYSSSQSNISKSLTKNMRQSQYASVNAPSMGNNAMVSAEKANGNEMWKSNKFEKMISEKQIEVIKELKNSRLKNKNEKSKEKSMKMNVNVNANVNVNVKGESLYLSKIEALRRKVENKGQFKGETEKIQRKGENLMRLSSMSNKSKLPTTVAEIKMPKPKIRLLLEKETTVEESRKQLLQSKNLQMYKSIQVRKTFTSSFFKQPSPEKQKKEQQKKDEQKIQTNIIDMKPVTQYGRSMSAANISSNNFLKSHTGLHSKYSFANKTKKKKQNKSQQKSSNLSINSQKNENSKVSTKFKQFQSNEKSEQNLRMVKQNNEKSEQNLRMVNSQLRDLKIKSIYGEKLKKSPIKNPYSSRKSQVEQSNASIEKMEPNSVDKQLRLLKNRLKQLSIRRVYENKATKQNQLSTQKQKREEAPKSRMSRTIKDSSPQKLQKSLQKKTETIIQENQISQKQLQQKQSQKQKLLFNLSQKDNRIEQLLSLLKKQQQLPQNKPASITEQQMALKLQKQKKLKQIEELRSRINIENKLIKQKMEKEQKKYIELKEQQFKIKQEEMLAKYAVEMKQVKEEYMKRNQELELKIMEEQRIRKQNQIKMIKEQRQMEQLRMQIEEKKLREQLLEEILKQQRAKQENEEQLWKNSEEERKLRLKQQLLEKQEIERKVLENYEEDNRKLNEMFEMMRRQNEKIEKQNMMKISEIKKLEEENKMEVASEMLGHKQEEEDKQINRQKEVEVEVEGEVEGQGEEGQGQGEGEYEDIQDLKLRIKQQILQEMMMKRKIEEQEIKREEKQRAIKLAEMEEEIRRELKRQEQQMDRIEKQQRERYNQIKKKLEDEIQQKMRADSEKQEELQRHHKQQMEKEMQKMMEMKYENPQKQNIKQQAQENSRAILKNDNKSQKQQNQQQREQPQQQLQNQQQREQPQQQLQQKPQQQVNNKVHKAHQAQNIKNTNTNTNQQEQVPNTANINVQKENTQIPDSNVKKQQQRQTKQNQTIAITKMQKSSKDHIEEPSQKLQSVKQANEEIINKYQQLQQHLVKSKQIYIEDRAIPEFTSNFYAALAPEVREMMQYSQKELEKMMNSFNRKVDIFEGQNGRSIGWMEADRYVLIGQISCIENIVRKYGQVQIEMVYIFNKNNPYQKQFLGKQIKIFDKVGYIFQKKLKQENMYSIKLIIKVPSEVLPKNQQTPTNQLTLTNKIVVQNNGAQKQENLTHSFSYLLSQVFKNCLSEQQLLELKEKREKQSQIIQEKMHWKAYNDEIFKTNQTDDSKIQITAAIHLKYVQTQTNPCYVLKGREYGGNDEKIYVSAVNQTLSIVAFQYDPVPDMGLDVVLDIKSRKLQKIRDVLVCMPIWNKRDNLKLSKPGPRKFTYSSNSTANLSFGSIISTNIQKQQFKQIQPPFVFSLFETNAKGLLLRPLYGELVEKSNVMAVKR